VLKGDGKPDVVPEKIVNPIDRRLLFVIFGLVGALQIYVYASNASDQATFVTQVVSAINPLAGAVMGFVVAKRYWHSIVFGRAYLALALGMFMNFLGALSYDIYSSLGLQAIPSIADVFYLAFYPLALCHLILNIRYFKAKISKFKKILIITIPVLMISAYSVVGTQVNGGANFNFFYGLSYVLGSTILFAGAILGALIFRQGVLGTAWLLLVIGITFTTFGDNWYSYVELFNQYSIIHPVNLMWYAGYMIITYALFKHRDTM